MKAQILDFTCDSVHEGLTSIGMSPQSIKAALAVDLNDKSQVIAFAKRFGEEARQAYWGNYQTNDVPKLYSSFVIPHLPANGTWLDVGCGKGVLLHQPNAPRSLRRVGIDTIEHPEWKFLENEGIAFYKYDGHNASEWFSISDLSCVTMTWTLHHMPYEEQERTLANLANHARNARLILVEDAYSISQPPTFGQDKHDRFMTLSRYERQIVMHTLDTLANRLLRGDTEMTIPGTYRTLEGWHELIANNGFRPVHEEYLGFPKHRDVHTPQCVMVFDKVEAKR